MIITKIMGGMGNQMFQYAFGRTLADRYNVELKLDISFFKGTFDDDVTPREYQLNNFNIRGDILTDNINNLIYKKNSFLYIKVSKALQKILPYYKKKYIKQKNKQFDKNLLRIKPPVYIDGYWQSDKYFVNNMEKIKKDFSLKNEPDEDNRKILNNINKSNAVCLHVRRGDYATEKVVRDVFESCSLEYYHEAIKLITGKIKNPVFFVFSDDIEWTKENIKTCYPVTFVDINTSETAYEDLRLMLKCKHFIIANSSFSWWGAMLAENPDKLVFAPEKWYKNNASNKDIYPESWMKL